MAGDFTVSNSFNLNFIESCRKIISIDSSPTSSTVELVDYLSSLAAELGLQSEVLHEMHNGIMQANIIIRAADKQLGVQDFLLQTHLDTVDPGHFPLWKKNHFNPFDAVIEDQKIYGLGTAEVKLDFLCKLLALAHFKNINFKKLSPVLIGTFGEETGMQGALKLIRKNKIQAKYALIGEPSQFQIINAAKGFATVEMRIPFSQEEIDYKKNKLLSESTSTQTKVFFGKTAHSSTPHLGESAAVKVLEYLDKLPDNMVIVEIDAGTRFNMIPHQAMVELDIATSFKDPIIKKINYLYKATLQVQNQMKDVQDDQFEPLHSTLTIGVIRTFDDHILIGGSCRILPNVKQEDYEKWMNNIQTACEFVGANFKLQDYKRPFRLDSNSILVRSALAELEKMGIESKCISLPSTNEASLFSRLGVECLCIGAGIRENNLHTPNENVAIHDLDKMTEFYQKMIERFCL